MPALIRTLFPKGRHVRLQNQMETYLWINLYETQHKCRNFYDLDQTHFSIWFSIYEPSFLKLCMDLRNYTELIRYKLKFKIIKSTHCSDWNRKSCVFFFYWINCIRNILIVLSKINYISKFLQFSVQET